ncbi:MAG: aldolase/citrate lyase family protein, partial [Candidatus Latescibacteria bacterium]|nr:aldolase/citrate lyase family protein [Candidatus Latescibacterota bacterium]
GAGFDYVIFDNEHSAYSRNQISELSWAFGQVGIVPIIRIPIPDAHYVTMALDGGAQGVFAPYCETVEQVKEVVGAAKLRPLKGEYLKRALDTGEFPSEESKVRLTRGGERSVVIIGIESVPALENLDAILEVDGIDVIFIGPSDMTTSMGIPGQTDHPRYQDVLGEVLAKCKARGVALAVHMFDTEMTTRWMQEGMQFVLFGMDTGAIVKGYRPDFETLRGFGDKL